MTRLTPRLACLLAALLTFAIDRKGIEQVLLLVLAALVGTVLVLAVAGHMAGAMSNRRRV